MDEDTKNPPADDETKSPEDESKPPVEEGDDDSEGAEPSNEELKKAQVKIQQLEKEKAKLLKDTMKNKSGKTEAEKKVAELQAQITDLVGEMTPDQVKEILASRKKAEDDEIEKTGDVKKLQERMAAEHKKAVDKLNGEHGAKVKDLQGKLEKSEAKVRKLTVSNSFANSDYLKSETLLTAKKAEKLYGEYFKTEERDGEIVVVGYIGDEPIADAEGNALSFEDALKEIFSRDPEHETLLKAKAKPGSGSGTDNKKDPSLPTTQLRGAAAIAKGLREQKKK